MNFYNQNVLNSQKSSIFAQGKGYVSCNLCKF